MANSTTLQLSIDDSSPTVQYFPFADTLGQPDLLAGWNPYFTDSFFAATPGETGNGTSLHLTSHDGAAISLTFFGTGIQLFGNVTQSASYDLQLDGTTTTPAIPLSASDPSLLASYADLDAGNHTVSLIVHNPSNASSNIIAFDRAVILVNQTGTTDINSTLIDDTRIPFLGTWSFERDSSLASLDGSDTFHTSSNSGDFFSLMFNGSAVSVSGFQDFNSGHYSVTVDGVVSVFNAQSSFREPTTLFYMTGLSANATHNLTVVNLDNRLLAIGSINVTTFNTTQVSPGSTAHAGLPGSTIAAIVVASVLGAVLFCLLAFLLYRRRRLSLLPRHGAADEEVLDSDIVFETGDMDERKPPSKVSISIERRDGSNNSRSFTLSLPMQQSQSRGSPRDDHSPSIQELPRSPSVSLVGGQVQNGSNNDNGGDKVVTGRKSARTRSASQSYALPLAQYPSPPEQYRPQPRQSLPQPPEVQQSEVGTNDPVSPASALAGYNAALASAVAALQPSVPVTDAGRNSDSDPDNTRQGVPKNARSTGYSFLDISSREGSGQDDQESPVNTSSSGSWGPRYNRMSQQTGRSALSQQSSGRPVSMGYAIEHERGTDLGLFRPSQPRSTGPTHARRSSEPTLLAIPPNLPPPSAPPLRPLPRIPQFPQLPIVTPPSAGPSRTEGLPALSLQTRFDFPAQPAPTQLSQPRDLELAAAAATASVSATLGRWLRPPSFLGPRRQSLSANISPTESLPVSDIQFRREDDSEENSPAQAVSPPTSAPAQRSYASPFILQTLRGERPSIGSPSEHIPSITHNPSAESVERLPGPSFAPGLERQRH